MEGFEVDSSIPLLLERQATRNSDQPAVWTKNRTLTFRQLHDAANSVAGAIRNSGAAVERPTAILLAQGCDLIASILGALAAGRFYVPLDTNYPDAWRRRVFQHSTASLILCDANTEAAARELAGDALVVRIDNEVNFAGEAQRPPSIPPEAPAYIYYTSGSTGEPKGVLDSHRNVLHNVRRYVNSLAIGRRDRLTLLQSPGFSGAVSTMFSALAAGACLYPFNPLRATPAELARWARETRVTMWHSTPSLFRLLCAGGEDFPEVRVVRLEGDQASPADFELFRDRFAADSVLVNGLGATETGIVRQFFLQPSSRWDGRVLPVGYAVEDMQVETVSDEGSPVVGQTGEIAVTSRYLALGYWRQPDLTAARFRPCKGDGPEVRTYLTGDLGRMNEEGCLELLGRKDDRFKIRGQWASTPEIEAELCAIPDVRESAVVALDGRHDEKRLVAYFTIFGPSAPTASEMRSRLIERLPGQPVPSAFVELDALPLTANGKVDRRALPSVPHSRPKLDTAFRPPQTPTEVRVAEVWKLALELDEVGVDDDFFELGGDSLDAVRVAATLGAPAAELYRRTTIREVAETLEASKNGKPLASSFRARIAKLSPAKRVLLEKRLQDPSKLAAQRIPRIEARSEYPLSFTQRRLWFFEHLTPGTSTYNVRSSFRIRGALDLDALEAALRQLVDRHAPLRTTFHETEAGTIQRSHDDWQLKLERITLPRSPSTIEQDAFERLWREEARPFDLTASPPFRAAVIRITDDDCLLMLAMHHIITDGWSLNIISRDLAELYNAVRANRPAKLPELPISYGDHAVWEIAQAALPDARESVDFWVKDLQGAPAELPLPLDRRRPAGPSQAAGEATFGVPAMTRRNLEQFCSRHKATPFMAYFAAWVIVLHRHGAGDDIVVGVPLAGRTRSETANLVGFFVNTLGIRIRVSGTDTFGTLLDRVKSVVLDAMRRQDAPFEKIVESLSPPRRINTTPVFQTTLTYLSLPYDQLQLDGVACEHLPIRIGDTHFDTTLALDEFESEVRGRLIFRSDIFSRSTGERFIERFLKILEAIVQQPEAPIARLPMIGAMEGRLTEEAYRGSVRPFPQQTIHGLFRQAVGLAPDRIAIVQGEDELSFAELDERSGHIARALRSAGVERGGIVGLMIGRSADLIAAMLGVMKAGAAYMPLDEAEPAQRLREMLGEARPSAVIVGDDGGQKLEGVNVTTLRLADALAHNAAEQDCGNEPLPSDPAYVLFTSGSTGRPKAVVTPHQAVVRLLFGTDYSDFSDQETFLHMAPPSFDASTFEIWGALLHGGRCVVLPQRRPSLHEIGEAIRRHGVTTLWLTSSVFNAVIDESPEMLAGLRQLLIGGEALSVAHVGRALELLSNTRIINGYGPTECTTFACCYTIPRDLPENVTSIPIGQPIANTEAYVLDHALEPAPIGVPGELYLGGPGLAIGYLNDAELTAERFVRHPFVREPGARLYRTGDSARLLQDGALEFLGRRDGQVKIRGFRVELGEIEACLRSHHTVAQAAAAVRDDASGVKQLHAYVTANPGAKLDRIDFPAYLRSKLPDYMIPARVVALDCLPLAPNGKVERSALPDPPALEPIETDVKPADAVEEKLVAIWREVLDAKRAGPVHDFFALGGHSLLATRLITRIERELGPTLPIAALFEAPTPRAMAALLRRKRPHDGFLVGVQPSGSRRPLYVVGAGPWSRPLADGLGPDQPFLGIGLRSHDLVELPTPHRFTDLAARLAARLVETRPDGPYVLAGWCLDAVLAFETARQLCNLGADAPLVLMFDPSNPNQLVELAKPLAPRVLAKRIWFHVRNTVATGRLSGRVDELVRRVRRSREQADYWRKVRLGEEPGESGRAVLAAAAEYRAEPHAGRVVVFKPSASPLETVEATEDAWRPLAGGGLEIVEVPGNHGSMLQLPHVNELARAVRHVLERF